MQTIPRINTEGHQVTNHAACSAAANQFEFYKYLEYQRFERFVSDGRSRPAVDRFTHRGAGVDGCTLARSTKKLSQK